jgi:hypothetical protein
LREVYIVRWQLPLFVLVLFLLLALSPTHAAWLDEMMIQQTPAVGDFENGAFVYGGETRVRIPSQTVRPFAVRVPRFQGGCGGIDMFWGGFSMLDPDYLVQFGQSVLSAAPAYAFELALRKFCIPCANVMDGAMAMAHDLNNMSLDSCAVAQGMVEGGGRVLGMDISERATTGASSGSAGNWYTEFKGGLSDYLPDVGTWFNRNVAAHSIDRMARDLMFPGRDEHSVIMWETLKERILAPTNGVTISPSFSAASGFFPTAEDYVAFLRLLSGDFFFHRGRTGTSGDLLTEIFDPPSGFTPSDVITGVYIADKAVADNQTEMKDVLADWTLVISDSANPSECGVDSSSDFLDMIVNCNRVPVSYLADTGMNVFHVPPGYLPDGVTSDGFVTHPPQALTLRPPMGSYSTPREAVEGMINEVLNHLEATGAAGTTQSVALADYMTWQQIPVYFFTNKVGTLKQKYPSLVNKIRDDVVYVAAYSYAAGRLIAAIDQGEEILDGIRHPVERMVKFGYPDADALQETLPLMKRRLAAARNGIITLMAAKVEKRLQAIRRTLNEYLETERELNRSIAGSVMGVAYIDEEKN